ncbi:MAG TPA: AraC family transcriptional regulator [Ferrovaceae bacterium]|jgi:AraC-like DNA-binding protein|nr:AraC family transcriptional regulator [Ferrovaceae bacterium]HQU07394.1 AraC family transcriptional regulator [Ferrovaceae bacterium]
MDQLSILLKHFDIKTRVFAHGTLCSEANFDMVQGMGHIHIFKKAQLEIVIKDREPLLITEPSVIFLPKPTSHSLKPFNNEKVKLICATFSSGSPIHNPLIMGLPEVLITPISQLCDFETIFDLLYQERLHEESGKDQAIAHLMDYLMVRIYRFVIQEKLISSSAVMGLADPKIYKAIMAIHQYPGREWCLETLASEAGMSRTRFAEFFKQKVGMAPINYLTELRIHLAMKRLVQGKSIKSLYGELGYSSTSSFSRAFLLKTGMSPKKWLDNHRHVTTD